MPIRGYIIEKYNAMTNAYTCNRLVQEASALDMELRIVGTHDTMVSPHGVINHGKILEPVDFVINRYKWGREKDAINIEERAKNRMWNGFGPVVSDGRIAFLCI